MTDDIVTRLREHQNPWYPLDEAADEIERLRKDMQFQARLIGRHYQQLRVLTEERDRLREESAYYHKMCSLIADKNFTANEEIHRLRMIVSTFPCTCWINKPKCDVCQVKEQIK